MKKFFWKKENTASTVSRLTDASHSTLGTLTELGNSPWLGKGSGLEAIGEFNDFRFQFKHHDIWGIFDQKIVITSPDDPRFLENYLFEWFRWGSGKLKFSSGPLFNFLYDLKLNRQWIDEEKKTLFYFKDEAEKMRAISAEVDCFIEDSSSWENTLLLFLGWYLIVLRSYQERQAAEDLSVKTVGKAVKSVIE